MTKRQQRLKKFGRKQARKEYFRNKFASFFVLREKKIPETTVPCESVLVAQAAAGQNEPCKSSTARQYSKNRGIISKLSAVLSNAAFLVILFCISLLVFSMIQSKYTGGPPSMAGYQMYIVKGGSMSPAFEVGSLAFVEPVDPQTLTIGDIITYSSSSARDSLTTHRVMDIDNTGSGLLFTTKGDANEATDSRPVSSADIVGKVVYAAPYLGYLMNFSQTRAGIIALVFIPGFLIIAFEIRNLIQLTAAWEKDKVREKMEEKQLA